MKAHLIVVAALLLSGSGLAQENRATVLGHITESSGAVVVGAKIRVTNLETGIETAALSNSEGSYLASSLPAGRYAVSVETPGFKRAEDRDVTLRIQQIARLDFALEVGNL